MYGSTDTTHTHLDFVQVGVDLVDVLGHHHGIVGFLRVNVLYAGGQHELIHLHG
jgi:hypothetical protein